MNSMFHAIYFLSPHFTMKFSITYALAALTALAVADTNVTIPTDLSSVTSALASVAQSVAASVASPVNTPGYSAVGSITILSSSKPSGASSINGYSWAMVGMTVAGTAVISALL
jgi:hypothetical protein